jgi:uncharacterized protein (DUF433 family)
MVKIVSKPGVLGGKPVIEGTRISVEHILEMIGAGATAKDIAAGYPDLTEEAVYEAVRFAARQLRGVTQVEFELAR